MGTVSTKTKVLDRYLNGKSPNEIAESLNVSLQTTYKYISDFKEHIFIVKSKEIEWRLEQIKLIEKALFEAIANKDYNKIDELKMSYSIYLVN